jgi:hypothetical protein
MRGSLCEPVGVLLVNIVRSDRWRRAACHGVVHRAIRKLRRSRLYNAGILRQARSGTLPRSLQHKAGGPSTRLDSDGHASGLEGPVPGACVPASPVAGSVGCWHFRREGLVEIRPAWHGPHATVHVMRPQAPVSHSPPAKPGQLMRARRARRRLGPGRRKAIWTRAHWARLAANGACCPVQSAVASHWHESAKFVTDPSQIPKCGPELGGWRYSSHARISASCGI